MRLLGLSQVQLKQENVDGNNCIPGVEYVVVENDRRSSKSVSTKIPPRL